MATEIHRITSLTCTARARRNTPTTDMSAQPGSEASVARLRDLVSLWLTASKKPDAQMTPELTPWFNWMSPQGVNVDMNLLTTPPPIVHHPRTGCSPSSMICYTSIAFLTSLLNGVKDLGPLVVDIGPFLGESTVGLAEALHKMNLVNTKVVSVDHWREHTGYTGHWFAPTTWKPPPEIATNAELLKATPPPLFWAFYKNVNHSGFRTYVQPLPLWEAHDDHQPI